jgi:hypothetical protein
MLEMITLYHVTPQANFDSIMEFGVSPAYAETRIKCVWLCDDQHLAWAMAHVSEKRDVSVLRLLVCVLAAPKIQLRRTKWAGVFQCLTALYPTNVDHASRFLRDEENVMQVRAKSSKL